MCAVCWIASFLAVLLPAGQSQNAPAPPTGERIAFPEGYPEKYQVLRLVDKADKKQVVTVYGNDAAGSIKSRSQLPYPYGSIIVMETSSALTDAQGKVMLDDKGHIMIIATHNTDNGDGWEREGEDDGFFHEFSEKRAYPLAINIIFYTMTH